jgi:hypothetical protein
VVVTVEVLIRPLELSVVTVVPVAVQVQVTTEPALDKQVVLLHLAKEITERLQSPVRAVEVVVQVVQPQQEMVALV